MEEKGEKGDLLVYFISGFIFISAFLFYIGTVISKNIIHPVTYGLFWFIYIITLITFGNSLFNYYTLVTLNKKEAVIGSQGEKGIKGDMGDEAECDRDCKLKVYSNYVMQKLDTAYNKILEKTRNTTNNPPRKINNQYIKGMVLRICDSQQFKDVSQLKHPTNLSDYISQIFIKWISIIADADKSEGKKHFQDYMEIYGEQVEWESIIEAENNPFHEIEKYDIFYWGLDKEFHPIKIQTCLPQEKVTKKKAPIKLIKTNVYQRITDDIKMGTRRNMSLWITEPMKFQGDTYYPLGTIAISNSKPNIGGGRFIEKIGGDNPVRYDLPGSKFTGPTKTNVMISADSKWIKFPDPNSWSWQWSAQKSTGWKAKIRIFFRRIKGKDMSFYNAEDFTEDGELYRCFGSAVIPKNVEPKWSSYYTPSKFFGRDKVKMVCVNDKALEEVPQTHSNIWDDARGERRHATAIHSNEDGEYNLAYFQRGRNPNYGRKTYRIKKEFLDETMLNEPPFTTNTEKDTGFAVGFQDVKYDTNRKGSLFDLLDLVIKSPLRSIYTNQMLFIEHTGLNNPNSYFIKTKITDGKCLKVTSNNEKIEIKECNAAQDSQVWEVEFLGQSKEICLLKSVNSGKYLYSSKSNVFNITGDLQSRNINDRILKPFQWRIIQKKAK
jgi:hypothetical protein